MLTFTSFLVFTVGGSVPGSSAPLTSPGNLPLCSFPPQLVLFIFTQLSLSYREKVLLCWGAGGTRTLRVPRSAQVCWRLCLTEMAATTGTSSLALAHWVLSIQVDLTIVVRSPPGVDRQGGFWEKGIHDFESFLSFFFNFKNCDKMYINI